MRQSCLDKICIKSTNHLNITDYSKEYFASVFAIGGICLCKNYLILYVKWLFFWL